MRQVTFATFLAFALLGLMLSAPTPATAQETEGYDPDSPAGVEYQLPLPRTRREATGQDSGDRRVDKREAGAKPTPLFGVGAGSAKRQANGGSPREATGGSLDQSDDSSAQSGDAGGRRKARRKATRSNAADVRARNTVDDDGDSPLQLGLTGGVLLVLAGAIAGIAVRLRARRGSPGA